jgi:hypothetical protein
VSDDIVRRTTVRPSAGFVDQLVYPVERPLPRNAPVESITVTYAEATSSSSNTPLAGVRSSGRGVRDPRPKALASSVAALERFEQSI